MPNAAKLLAVAHRNPADMRFSELVRLLKALGYTLARTTGSHQIFTADNLPMVNLQKSKGKAKPYQVRQVLSIIETHNLKVE